MRKFADFRIQIDYEKSKSLKFLYKASTDAAYTTCFEIEHILRYISTQGNFLQVLVSTGKKYTMKVNLSELKVNEKQHRLDVEDSLLVSHELVEEIFDKVHNFSTKLNSDKEGLKGIIELQNNLLEKSKYFEIFTKDLYLGTRKFQEHMIENLSKYKTINPESLPKMNRIKDRIKTLEQKQAKIFERFVSIKGLIASKKIFRKTRNYLKQIDKTVTELTNEIVSPEFNSFFKKTESLVVLLKKLNFKKLIDDVF